MTFWNRNAHGSHAQTILRDGVSSRCRCCEESEMLPDVEALLANRVGDKRAYFIAPIDKCYELVGTIRKHWKGLSGGEEVWREIDEFFTRLTNA